MPPLTMRSSAMFYRIVLLCVILCGPVTIVNGQHGYRRQMNAMRSMAQKAYEHGLRINEDAMCAKPRPELVYLTDTNKIYLPRATLLHRCSDLTGCCPHATHSCQPSQVETVSLYFFTISVHSRMRQNQNIEKLNFLNHTECSCVPVQEQGRSESLININETSAIHNDSHQRTGTPVVRADSSTQIPSEDINNEDERAAAMYHGDLGNNKNPASNSIDINNGGGGNIGENGEDTQTSVLKYWGKLLGLYKAKAHRDVYHSGRRQVEQSVEQQPPIVQQRIDAQSPPTSLVAPSARNPASAALPPYQSQYNMLMYPSASPHFSFVPNFPVNFAKYRTLNSDGYKLTYRTLE